MRCSARRDSATVFDARSLHGYSRASSAGVTSSFMSRMRRSSVRIVIVLRPHVAPVSQQLCKKKNRQLRLAVWFEYSGFVSFESSSALPPVATESVVKPKPIADREEIHCYLITQDPERAQIGGAGTAYD